MSYTPPPPPPEEPPGGMPPGGTPPGGPGYGGPGYGAPGYGPAAYGTPKNNTKAVVSLVIGIVSLPLGLCCAFFGLTGIAAVLVGNSAKKEILASGGMQTGFGMAKAGVVLGIIGIVLGVIMTGVNVLLMINGNGSEFNPYTG